MTITARIGKSRNMPESHSAMVSFPYSQAVLDEIRSYRHRKWYGTTKEWEITLDELEDLIYTFYKCTFEISGTFVNRKPPTGCLPDEFKYKTEPFSHQRDGVIYGMSHNRWLLGDEQGLGKTKQVIDIAVAKKIECGYRHCLIICGVNGLKWNWQNEVKTHSDEDAYILGQRTKKTGVIKIGTNHNKLDDVVGLNDNPAYFIITNIETLRDKSIVAALSSQIECGEINMVAIDEMHNAKSTTSQQGKGILELKPEYRIAMTGTPLMNSPLDLYIILKWLGYESHSFFAFKSYYCIMGGFGGYEIVGYRHLDELDEQLSSIMLRRTKSEVLDLPEKIYISEYVDMPPKQQAIYTEIRRELLQNVDLITGLVFNPLAKMTRLRQASAHTGLLSSGISVSAKFDRMIQLIDDSLDNGKKVVVFSNWSSLVALASDRLTTHQIKNATITGDTPDASRQTIVNDFQTNESLKVIIGTFGAMGTGLTLTAGSTVILLDEPWTMATREQAVDRCHRIGTSDNITVYTLMCKNTIDERVHEIMEKKGAMSDILIDGAGQGDRQKLVDFLLGIE